VIKLFEFFQGKRPWGGIFKGKMKREMSKKAWKEEGRGEKKFV